MMIFSSIPSMFFEEPVDTADNTGPQAVYQPFKDYDLQAYQEDIEKDFQQRIAGGEFSAYVHVLLGKHADTGNVVRNQTAHAGDSAVLTSMYSAMRRS